MAHSRSEHVSAQVRLSRGGLILAVLVSLLLVTAADNPLAEAQEPGTHPVPITVFGRAINQAGKPIAGAEIFLASPRTDGKPLATAKTGDDGTYRFEKVPLPIERADTNISSDTGTFEVFGRAEGFGFAWRPLKTFYPNSAHVEATDLTEPRSFGREDPIEIDVRFGPPATLRGRIVNDLGEPLAGARLAIRDGAPWDRERRPSFESFNWPSLVPEVVKVRRTDDNGRFEFTGLPNDCKFWMDVIPARHPSRSICATTGERVDWDPESVRIYSGDFEVVFPRPRQVKLHVVYGDTGKAAHNVGVGGTGFWATTDDEGLVETPLPDGRCQLSIFPRYGTPYLRTDTEVVVSADTAKEPITFQLRPAAVVDITVVDGDTGKPLGGVDVWLNPHAAARPIGRAIHGYRSWDVESRLIRSERPRTDKDGKMRVLFEPGHRRIGVGVMAFPKDYEPVPPDGLEIDCQPGKPTALTFHMRKRGRDDR